jgi:hypothetical protein
VLPASLTPDRVFVVGNGGETTGVNGERKHCFDFVVAPRLTHKIEC